MQNRQVHTPLSIFFAIQTILVVTLITSIIEYEISHRFMDKKSSITLSGCLGIFQLLVLFHSKIYQELCDSIKKMFDDAGKSLMPPQANTPAALSETNLSRLESVNFPLDLVPNEFCCDISRSIMSHPVKLSLTTQTYDFLILIDWIKNVNGASNLRQTTSGVSFQFLNLGNNQSITYPNDVILQEDLRDDINLYVDTILKKINEIRQRQPLTFFSSSAITVNALYENIHEQAMAVVQHQRVLTHMKKQSESLTIPK